MPSSQRPHNECMSWPADPRGSKTSASNREVVAAGVRAASVSTLVVEKRHTCQARDTGIGRRSGTWEGGPRKPALWYWQ